ncbi:MAG TPA: hypothetical protein VK425_00160 [Acidimicrobiales bacterium]|nr:hypothetical protein [Acidimicrobiales bacterium]
MKLSGADGTSVALVPVGYEFPEATSGSMEANWLLVDLTATTERGTWSSRDACLTTGEAAAVDRWLRSLAAGGVPVSLPDADGEITPGLSFLEPDLAFSLAPGADGLKHLRVHLNYELAPPWLDMDERCALWRFFVELALADADILAAAAAWKAELALFPGR